MAAAHCSVTSSRRAFARHLPLGAELAGRVGNQTGRRLDRPLTGDGEDPDRVHLVAPQLDPDRFLALCGKTSMIPPRTATSPRASHPVGPVITRRGQVADEPVEPHFFARRRGDGARPTMGSPAATPNGPMPRPPSPARSGGAGAWLGLGEPSSRRSEIRVRKAASPRPGAAPLSRRKARGPRQAPRHRARWERRPTPLQWPWPPNLREGWRGRWAAPPTARFLREDRGAATGRPAKRAEQARARQMVGGLPWTEDGGGAQSPRRGEGTRCGAAGRGAGELPTVLNPRLSHPREGTIPLPPSPDASGVGYSPRRGEGPAAEQRGGGSPYSAVSRGRPSRKSSIMSLAAGSSRAT